jgi:hypothetical protein
VVSATSLKNARRILGDEGFDRPKQHFRVNDKDAERLALTNPGVLIWQSLDDWEAGAQSWQVGDIETFSAKTSSKSAS